MSCAKCENGYITVKKDGYLFSKPCECMAQERLERDLHSSGIKYAEYTQKTLDTFDTATPTAQRMKDTALAFLDNYADATGCAFFGKPGTGKTHIAIAICLEATKRYKDAHKYFSYRREMQRLTAALWKEQYQMELDRWTEAPILYIDDLCKLGMDREGSGLDQREARVLYDIVNTRYVNKQKTIFTGEMPLNELRRYDEAIASRIYDIVEGYAVKVADDEPNRRFVRANG